MILAEINFNGLFNTLGRCNIFQVENPKVISRFHVAAYWGALGRRLEEINFLPKDSKKIALNEKFLLRGQFRIKPACTDNFHCK